MGSSDPLGWAVLAVGVLASLLLVIAEFSTIASVDVASGSCEVINDSDPELADRCSLSGFERHGGAVMILGLVAALMAWGAAIGESRPAAVALIALGAIVVAIALLNDLPETGKTGAIGPRFAGAEGQKGTGLYLEIVGGVLAIAAGALRLTRRPAD
jgi:hypothetical protein